MTKHLKTPKRREQGARGVRQRLASSRRDRGYKYHGRARTAHALHKRRITATVNPALLTHPTSALSSPPPPHSQPPPADPLALPTGGFAPLWFGGYSPHQKITMDGQTSGQTVSGRLPETWPTSMCRIKIKTAGARQTAEGRAGVWKAFGMTRLLLFYPALVLVQPLVQSSEEPP